MHTHAGQVRRKYYELQRNVLRVDQREWIDSLSPSCTRAQSYILGPRVLLETSHAVSCGKFCNIRLYLGCVVFSNPMQKTVQPEDALNGMLMRSFNVRTRHWAGHNLFTQPIASWCFAAAWKWDIPPCCVSTAQREARFALMVGRSQSRHRLWHRTHTHVHMEMKNESWFVSAFFFFMSINADCVYHH